MVRYRQKTVPANSSVYNSGICLEELRKSTKIPSKDRRFTSRDSKEVPEE